MTDSPTLNDDQFAWVKRLAGLRAQKKAIEAAEKEAVAAIRAIANGAGTLLHDGQPVVWDRESTQSRIDVALLREQYPAIADACTAVTVVRRLTIAEGVA